MAYGEAWLFVRRPAADIADFILDLDSYKTVDSKIGKIYWIRRDGNEALFRFRPHLLGLPGPPTTQRVVAAEDGSGVQITGIPAWTDVLVTFAASFRFAEQDDGTWVTRRLDFDFKKPASWLLNPLFNRWLARDVAAELANAKRVLESAA